MEEFERRSFLMSWDRKAHGEESYLIPHLVGSVYVHTDLEQTLSSSWPHACAADIPSRVCSLLVHGTSSFSVSLSLFRSFFLLWVYIQQLNEVSVCLFPCSSSSCLSGASAGDGLQRSELLRPNEKQGRLHQVSSSSLFFLHWEASSSSPHSRGKLYAALSLPRRNRQGLAFYPVSS